VGGAVALQLHQLVQLVLLQGSGVRKPFLSCRHQLKKLRGEASGVSLQGFACRFQIFKWGVWFKVHGVWIMLSGMVYSLGGLMVYRLGGL